jgi:short-subunit dehydrogenase
LPGATDTEFFERAGMEDTKIGQSDKDDPADVARTGFDAMMKGEGDVVHGMKNKLQAAMSAITPESAKAEMHRKLSAPGSGDSASERRP